jgi:hypothetical protein
MAKRRKSRELVPAAGAGYDGLVSGISELLEQARRGAARSVNSILTAAYWEIGRRIVELEQGGQERAEYGEGLLVRLGGDLTARHGRGFSWRNLFRMRNFYLGWEILPTPSAKFVARVRLPAGGAAASEQISAAPSGNSQLVPAGAPLADLSSSALTDVFPLPWSQYVRLMSVANPRARAFYESEALRGGWSVRQLDRQISTQFFERTAHSKQQAAMLARGQKPKPEDAVPVQDGRGKGGRGKGDTVDCAKSTVSPFPASFSGLAPFSGLAVAIGRKNYLFFGSDVGGETAAVLYTFTQTCQALGIEPWRYLRDVLARLPRHPPERLAELLPDEWARAQRCANEAPSRGQSDEVVPPPSG